MTRSYNSKKGTTKGKFCRLEWKRIEIPYYHIDWFQRPPARVNIKNFFNKFETMVLI